MHPDYGMILTKKGAHESLDMNFLDIPLDHITLLNGDTFTTLVVITRGESKFAASFDFAMPFIADLARLSPPKVKDKLLKSITTLNKFPWHVEFDQPVRMRIKAHLGAIKQCEDEEFRPLIVDAVNKPCSSPDELTNN